MTQITPELAGRQRAGIEEARGVVRVPIPCAVDLVGVIGAASGIDTRGRVEVVQARPFREREAERDRENDGARQHATGADLGGETSHDP